MRRFAITDVLALALLALLILLPVACGGGSEGPDAGRSRPKGPPGSITIADAVVNLMPTGDQAAVYLRVINATEADDQLVAVETPSAEGASIHETMMEGEMLRMQERPEGFPVGSGDTLELTPSGKHIMLSGVEPGVAQRGSLDLTLKFARAKPITLEVPVRSIAGESGGFHEGMDHGAMDHGAMGAMDHGNMAPVPADGDDAEAPPASSNDEPEGIH